MKHIFPVIDVEGFVKRIPRPERSGYISVALMLFSLYTILHPNFGGSDCGFFSLHQCAVAADEVTQEEKESAVPIYFGIGHGEERAICHMDVINGTILEHTPVTISKELIGSFIPGVGIRDWLLRKKYPGVSTLILMGPWNYEEYRIRLHGQDVKLRWHCPKPQSKAIGIFYDQTRLFRRRN